MTNAVQNVFLLGWDDFHADYLHEVARCEHVRFHPLLHSQEVIYQQEYRIDDILTKARTVLDSFDGRIDGMITHWDFPAIPILAILCEERGLPGPTLEAVLKCSHKYWSRLEQQKVVPEHIPDFCVVDPHDPGAADRITVDYPFWLKPVTAYSSALGFHIEGRPALEAALAEAREEIDRIGEPVNELLARVNPPPEVSALGGRAMIAEAIIEGKELAPEGYVHRGRLQAHGLIDVVRGENGKSIEEVVYPSSAPDDLGDRATRAAAAVMRQIGFDHGCFNVEFFWDRRDDDKLWIVEINPRVSQSHSNLFEKVDGISNHAVAVQVALGQQPSFDYGAGPYRQAAKIFWRRYDNEDATVTRAPDEADLARFRERQPDTRVEIDVQPGQRLSELLDQDAYSYVLAELHIGGRDRAEIESKFAEARELLPFAFDDSGNEARGRYN